MSKKRIVILGSTGSIGLQTLDVVRQHSDLFEVVALAAYSSVDLLLEQAQEFNVKHIAFGKDSLKDDVRLANLDKQGICVGFGHKSLLRLIHLDNIDIIVNALVGAAGLEASYETLNSDRVLALANKESLVVGGDLLMPLATHETLLPIDSEHGAIYQCLLGERSCEVARLWVTASGGPFRGKTRNELMDVTASQALAHPTWNMGPKITIDSSTLMNKGLEVIEAHHLFGMPYDKISVVVQPQSVIHSMVEFIDGSVKAHLGTTDMRIPIQFALSYPDRLQAPVAPLNFCELSRLEFFPPDTETFPSLKLAYSAGKTGGTLPCVMNAANEVAVAAFLHDELAYLDIACVVEQTMAKHSAVKVENLEQLSDIDAWARQKAHAICKTMH